MLDRRCGSPGAVPTGLPVELRLGCRDYLTCGSKKGYGFLDFKNHSWRAHRLAYVLVFGPIPKEKPYICHLCNRPSCCEPSHLRAGTQAENIAYAKLCGRLASGDRHGLRIKPERRARGDRNGSRLYPERVACGERSGQAKLTRERVKTIILRRASGEPVQTLAEAFGVSQSAVYAVLAGTTWKRVWEELKRNEQR